MRPPSRGSRGSPGSPCPRPSWRRSRASCRTSCEWIEQLNEVDTAGRAADDQRGRDAARLARGPGQRRRPRRRTSSATRPRARATTSWCRRWSNEPALDRALTLAEARDGLASEGVLGDASWPRRISRRSRRRARSTPSSPRRPSARSRWPPSPTGASRRGDARPLEGLPLAIKDLFCTQGVPDHRRLAHPREFRAALRIDRHRQSLARGRGAARQDQSRRVRDGLVQRHQLLRPGGQSLDRAGRGRGRWCRAAARAARPRRSRRSSASARPAPIPAARSASRRRSAASSA